LEEGELRRVFGGGEGGGAGGMVVVDDGVEVIPDGRSVNCFLAHKPKSGI